MPNFRRSQTNMYDDSFADLIKPRRSAPGQSFRAFQRRPEREVRLRQNSTIKLVRGNDSFAPEFEEIDWGNIPSPVSQNRRPLSKKITRVRESYTYGESSTKSNATTKLRHSDHCHGGTKIGLQIIESSACQPSSKVAATRCPVRPDTRVFPRQMPSLAFPHPNTRTASGKSTRAVKHGPSPSTISLTYGQRRRAYLTQIPS